ncbi:MAG: hypothetical protein GY853_01935 [PVC group bacterium]|nr:hypothetical protein [PVC group bacterium]
MSDTTVVYYTDGSLDKEIEEFCVGRLIEAAYFHRTICVSQKPIGFGDINICVGDIGRSRLSLYKQILYGVAIADTKYIALAEHDVLYTSEHFNWTPPTDRKFYYNINHWLVDWNTGQYAYSRRKVLSMMIADKNLILRAVKDKISLLEKNKETSKDFGKNPKSYRAVAFRTAVSNLDIRHENNFSRRPKSNNRCYNIFYWGKFEGHRNEQNDPVFDR